ncbi:MAG: hypothetical protein GEU26_09920 [Nitrososphaeraceae archaeon]|nr:hypothetical protein [Nitrososphaeraceae archaeon]
MSYNNQEIKDLKQNLKQRTNLQKKRTNLRRLADSDNPSKMIAVIEEDIKKLNEHLGMLKKVLKNK